MLSTVPKHFVQFKNNMRKFNKFHIDLQFNRPDVPATKQTLTILMDYIDGRTVKDCIEDDLLSFVETHDRWCRDISASYLKHHRKIRFDEYAEDFPFFTLDSLGITLWARCYRKHVAIVCNYRFWCTRSDGDFDKCDIVLVYKGKGVFEDTRVKPLEECKDLGAILTKVQVVMDERALKENKDGTSQRRTRQQKRKSSRIYSSESEENLDLEDVLESGRAKPNKRQKKAKVPENQTDDNVQENSEVLEKETDNNVQKNSEVPENQTDDTVQENSEVLDKETDNNVQNKSEVPENQTDDTVQENSEVLEKEQESDNKVQKKEDRDVENNLQKKCSVLITLDDVTNALEYISAQKDAETKPKSANKMPKKNRVLMFSMAFANKISNKYKSSVKGSWKKAARQRRKPTGKEIAKQAKKSVLVKVYFCIVPNCKTQKGTKAALVRHIKNDHKDYRYKCRTCSKTFETITGRYKHELYHKFEKEFKCKYCKKTCMFKSEMDDHMRTHTGKNMFVCSINGCENSYASKRACTAHEKSHTLQSVYCQQLLEDKKTVCGQECVSNNHLKQHIRGMHGKGWLSPCGKRFSWPSTMYSHKSECKKCKKMSKK